MDNKTHIRQTSQTQDKLLRIKWDMGQVKGNFPSAAHSRIVGGVILLIGLLVLVGFLLKGNQFVAAIAVAGLVIGDLMFIRAFVKARVAYSSVNTLRAWRRIASYASIPETEVESEKWEKLYFYEPLRIESPTPNRVDRT